MAERDLRRKLFWLIAIRVGISTLLLGSAVFVQLTSPGTFPGEPLFLLIGVTYALNILWASDAQMGRALPVDRRCSARLRRADRLGLHRRHRRHHQLFRRAVRAADRGCEQRPVPPRRDDTPDPRLMVVSEDTELDELTEGTGFNLRWNDSQFSIQGVARSTSTRRTRRSCRAAGSRCLQPGDLGNPSGLQGYVELYAAESVSYPSRTDFAPERQGHPHRARSPTTTSECSAYRIRENLVLAQPEALAVAAAAARLSRSTARRVALGAIVEGLAPGRARRGDRQARARTAAPGAARRDAGARRRRHVDDRGRRLAAACRGA